MRVAIELHPGFVAYHTESFWRLREIGGEAIGVNFDPSHLFWQGMDPLVCVRELGDAIFHVHMKDTWLDQPNIARNGVLDTKPYTDEMNRSWIFRTVGYGHGQEFWRSLISELRLAGYDGALSIEHEDSIHERQRRLHPRRQLPQATRHHRATRRRVVGLRRAGLTR